MSPVIKSGGALNALIQSPGHAFVGSELDARMAKPTRQAGGGSPKQDPSESFWTRWGRVVTVVAPSVGIVFAALGFAYNALDKKIDRLDDRLTPSLQRLDDRLRGVEKGIAEIQAVLKYGPRAAALGFKNPDIKLIQLTPKATFSFVRDNIALTYTILRITPEVIEIKFDGTVGRDSFQDNLLIVPTQPARITRIVFPIGNGRIPPLYIAILDKRPPNIAVVAIGEATAAKG
jgi:hypothetical protein